MSAPLELPARAPEWIRQRKLRLADLHAVKRVMRSNGLYTVCEEARCPNRGECFARVSIEPAVHLVPVGIGDAGNTAKGRAEASAVGWAWSS